MSDNKQHLGYSPLTEKIYLGRQKGNQWVGNTKCDVTNEFIGVMLQKFEPNTSQAISINGENKYKVIVVDMTRKVTVNGKAI